MLATTKHFEPSYIEEAKDWGRERVITRIQIQLLPLQSSFHCPYARRKASAEPSEGKSQSPRVLVWGHRGMEGNQRTRWKERNECKRLHALSLHGTQGFRGKRKNSGLTGSVINPLSWRWAKEEGVGSKSLNSSKSTFLRKWGPWGKGFLPEMYGVLLSVLWVLDTPRRR